MSNPAYLPIVNAKYTLIQFIRYISVVLPKIGKIGSGKY